jgi:hypothetical protein
VHTKNTENLLFVVVLKEAQFVNAEKVVVMLKVKNVHFVELEKIKNLDVVLSGASGKEERRLARGCEGGGCVHWEHPT